MCFLCLTLLIICAIIYEKYQNSYIFISILFIDGGIAVPVVEKVLEILEDNRGRSVSGNKIAQSLGVTRSAVWKAVTRLREDGYSVSAVTNRGYRLNDDNDMINEPAINAFLKTESLGRSIDIFKTIDSTNDFAKSRAHLGAEHGALIVADHQTAGKGRMGKRFHSPGRSGIYMSVIVRPKFSVEYAMAITSCTAVAVAEAIENVTGLSCGVKWVNDIYCNGKKLCGILTEASIGVEQGGLDYVVIGIGLNVSNAVFPRDLENIATSLRLETGKKFSRAQLIAEILNCLEKHLEEIPTHGYIDEYRRRSIFIGHDIIIRKNNAATKAKCLDIDNLGKLLVKYEDGTEAAISSGTVELAD